MAVLSKGDRHHLTLPAVSGVMEDWSSAAQVTLRTADGVFNHTIWSPLKTSAVDINNKLHNESDKSLFVSCFFFFIHTEKQNQLFCSFIRFLSGCSSSYVYDDQITKRFNSKRDCVIILRTLFFDNIIVVQLLE